MNIMPPITYLHRLIILKMIIFFRKTQRTILLVGEVCIFFIIIF
jgi:hypothetical protein